MAGTNDFLGFALDGGANVESQGDYSVDTKRTLGNQPGIASSAFNNKAIRQANFIASQFAQYLAVVTNANIEDNTNTAELLAQITSALGFKRPITTILTSGSGTFGLSYKFQLSSANATAAATYTNNGVTYTVSSTIAGGAELIATGSGAPTAFGTLVKTSGSGDATITFFAVRIPIYLEVEGVGGGGGSSGGGTVGGGTGGTGGNTTFGTITANGGAGGIYVNNPPAAATATLGSGPVGIAVPGGVGSGGGGAGASSSIQGGAGAGTPYSGMVGGGWGGSGSAATAAQPNTGCGGGGPGDNAVANTVSGSGGNAGAFFKAKIFSPTGTYAYSVGAAGTAGTAGTSGLAGAVGGSGIIIVTQYYQ